MSAKRRHRWLLVGALALSLGVWLIGVDEDFLFGHSGWCGARRAVAAQNFERYGFEEAKYGPVENFSPVEPDEFRTYWHHPVGIHLLVGVSFRVLGEGEWQARIVPVLLMLASFLLFYLMAREWWRGPGLWAALALFATIPMLGYYGPFVNQEPLVLVFCLAVAWLQTRWAKQPRAPILVATVVVAALAAWSDWPWFPFAFALAVVELARLWLGRSPDVRWFVALCLGVGIGLFGVLAHLIALQGSESWVDGFLHLFEFRSGGEDKTLEALLVDSGDRWVELFTPTLIVAGAAFAPLTAWDAARGRLSMKHGVAWAFLFVAVVWTLVFKQGATIHEYWPFYAAPFFVIAGADVVARLAGLLGRIHRDHRILRHAGPAVVGALIVLQVTSGMATVIQRHRHPDVNGWEADDWRHPHAVLGRWIREHTEPDDRVALQHGIGHAGFQLGFYQRRGWRGMAIHGSTRRLRPPAGVALAVVDLKAIPQQAQAPLLEDMVERYPVTVLEPFVIADVRREGEGPEVRWLRFETREPSLAHRWFESMIYRPYELVRDPLMEARLLLSTGHRERALARYAGVDVIPDDLARRVADHDLARAAGRQHPDPTDWLPDYAPLPEGLDEPVSFGGKLTLLGMRVTPPHRRGLVVEAVWRVDEAPGEGWRAFVDRYGSPVCHPDRREKAGTSPRIFPDLSTVETGDLVHLERWVPLHPDQRDVELQLGFWRPTTRGEPHEHLRVGDDVGLTVRPRGLRGPTTWAPWLAWLDTRWLNTECD